MNGTRSETLNSALPRVPVMDLIPRLTTVVTRSPQPPDAQRAGESRGRSAGTDRPILLDLFCGAGGSSAGYHRAGFDVVGVDIRQQPNYPFTFHRANALEFAETHGRKFDAIHASPPCHDHSRYTSRWGSDGTGHLLPDTRELLEKIGVPWTIENVPGAPMRADFTLCGCFFGLPGLRRQRLFETSWYTGPGNEFRQHDHTDHTVTVTGHPGGSSRRDGARGFGSFAAWKQAMDIYWMSIPEITQAIPPAYTEYVGRKLLGCLNLSQNA